MIPNIETIVLATGLGSGAPYVFSYALSLARKYNAKIDVVYGLEPLRPYAQFVAETYLGEKRTKTFHKEARDRVRETIQKRLEKLCAEELAQDTDKDMRVKNIHVIEASPDQAVLRHAEAVKADLIVMGTHSKTMEKGALIGSCAFKIMHGATAPVLLVRIPEGFEDMPHLSEETEFMA